MASTPLPMPTYRVSAPDSPPDSPQVGDIFLDSTTMRMKYWLGDQWVDMGSHQEFQVTGRVMAERGRQLAASQENKLVELLKRTLPKPDTRTRMEMVLDDEES